MPSHAARASRLKRPWHRVDETGREGEREGWREKERENEVIEKDRKKRLETEVEKDRVTMRQ